VMARVLETHRDLIRELHNLFFVPIRDALDVVVAYRYNTDVELDDVRKVLGGES